MNFMNSNQIFQARTLMAEGKSLKDTAKLLNTTQATVRRYLPEQAEQAVLLNKPTTKSRKYITKGELLKLISLKLGKTMAKSLENAPMETVEQIFRSLGKN